MAVGGQTECHPQLTTQHRAKLITAHTPSPSHSGVDCLFPPYHIGEKTFRRPRRTHVKRETEEPTEERKMEALW